MEDSANRPGDSGGHFEGLVDSREEGGVHKEDDCASRMVVVDSRKLLLEPGHCGTESIAALASVLTRVGQPNHKSNGTNTHRVLKSMKGLETQIEHVGSADVPFITITNDEV